MTSFHVGVACLSAVALVAHIGVFVWLVDWCEYNLAPGFVWTAIPLAYLVAPLLAVGLYLTLANA